MMTSYVSIPKGSIKSEIQKSISVDKVKFQFQKVRLKVFL